MISDFIAQGIVHPTQIDALAHACTQENRHIVFIDASFVLPTSGENVFDNFVREHIPQARFFDIEAVCDRASNLPHMLPTAETFAQRIGDLGVTNNDVIVIYGQSGMIMGPARLWWMMRGFGHHDVLVLDGGLPAWKRAGLPTQNNQTAKTFPATGFSAQSFDSEMLVALPKVLDASNTQSQTIIDARPAARWSGQAAEPRAGMRSGHIPHSKNLPCSLLVGEDGCFKSRDALRKLFEEIGYRFDNKAMPVILTCGSGITACALGLALFYLGHDDFCVYDGSWSEWGAESCPTPVNKSIE